VTKAPSSRGIWYLDLAQEILSIKRALAPLRLWPLADAANDIVAADDEQDRAFEEKMKEYQRWEQAELEAFAKTTPPDYSDQAFTPSESLKRTLQGFALQWYKRDAVAGWKDLFREVYIELLSGKITPEEAGGKLEKVDTIDLRLADLDLFADKLDNAAKDRIQEIYDLHASKWDAAHWRARLDHLRDMKKFENEEETERKERVKRNFSWSDRMMLRKPITEKMEDIWN